MRPLRVVDASLNPLVQELELLQRLQTATAGGIERLRLRISGRQLFLDGFVESLEQKLRAERTCQELAPGSMVVNRLRVAAAEGPRVS